MRLQPAKPPKLFWSWLALASITGALSGVVFGFIAYVLWPWDVMIDHNLVYLSQAWVVTALMHFALLLLARFAILPFLPNRDRPMMFPVAGFLAVIALFVASSLAVGLLSDTAFGLLEAIWSDWTYPGDLFPRLIFAAGVGVSGLIYVRLTAISRTGLRPTPPNR